jgi:hypothetical protein
VGGSLLNQALTIVEVKLSRSLTLGVGNDDKLKVTLADLGGGHSTLGLANGKDRSSTDEERDLVEGNVVDGLVTRLNGLVGVEVVPDVLGKIDVDGGGVLDSDGSNNDGRSVQVLEVHSPNLLVLRVLEPERRDGGNTGGGLTPHSGVEVVEEGVTDSDGLAGSGGSKGPAVGLLGDGGVTVVVTEERSESSKSSPTSAKSLSGVSTESTNVGTDERNLVKSVKLKNSRNGVTVVVPGGQVVSEPLSDLVSGTSKGGTSDDERSLSGAAREHGIVGSSRHGSSVKVVNIVLKVSIGVDNVGVDSAVRESVSNVVLDGVGGADDVLLGSGTLGDLRAGLEHLHGSSEGAGLDGLLLGLGLGETGNGARRLTNGETSRRHLLGNGLSLGVSARVRAEVGGLVHVDPRTVNVDTLVSIEETGELISPVLGGVGVEPVGESGNTGPDDSLVDVSVGLLEEDSLLNSALEGGVGLVGNRGVNHHNVLLVVLVQVVDNAAHLVKREALGVKSENPTVVHVVDVGPHGLEGNGGGAVVGDNLSNVDPVTVSVTTLVRSKSPVGGDGGKADNLSVLRSNVGGGRTGQEVEVEDSSNDVILQNLIVDLDVHTVGVDKEDSVSSLLTVLIVDGVSGVQVGVLRNSIGVTVPESAGVVGGGELERGSVLSQSVDRGVLSKLGSNTYVLVLEDEGSVGLEQLLAGGLASDGESEGLLLELEVDVGVVGLDVGLAGTREGEVRNLVTLVPGVDDLDVKALLYWSLLETYSKLFK